MEAFKKYLQEKKYRPNTIKSFLQVTEIFLKWWESNGADDVENVQYSDLLNYVQHEQQRNINVSSVNIRLGAIKRYFEFLRSTGAAAHNPAATLRIKGTAKTVTDQPLSFAELEKLYSEYKKTEPSHAINIQEKAALAHERSVIITGLMIWQGLHSGELEKLEAEHINLSEGTIYIPGAARSNSRCAPPFLGHLPIKFVRQVSVFTKRM